MQKGGGERAQSTLGSRGGSVSLGGEPRGAKKGNHNHREERQPRIKKLNTALEW